MEKIREKQKYVKRKVNEELIRVIPKIFPVSHKDLFNYYFQSI